MKYTFITNSDNQIIQSHEFQFIHVYRQILSSLTKYKFPIMFYLITNVYQLLLGIMLETNIKPYLMRLYLSNNNYLL